MHTPVLTKELITGLNIIPGGHYLDATLGRGGHSRLILQAAPDIKLTAIDRDKDAIKESSLNLADYGKQINYWGRGRDAAKRTGFPDVGGRVQ